VLVKANPISRKTAIRKKKKKKRTFTSEKPCYERDLERSSPRDKVNDMKRAGKCSSKPRCPYSWAR